MSKGDDISTYYSFLRGMKKKEADVLSLGYRPLSR